MSKDCVKVSSLKAAQAKDGFSFPEGMYVELNELLIEENVVTQKICKKSKLVLDMYKRLPDKYILLYQKQLEVPLPLSKKLDVKYIYNISARSVNLATVSQFGGTSAAAAVRREYMEKDRELRCQLAEKEQRFERRADNYERFLHESFYTNEERYFRGKMSRNDYYDEMLNRNYRKHIALEKAQDAVSGNLKAMHYYSAKAAGEAHASRKRVMEQNERIRMMSVGEAVYCDGELLALVVYKGERDVREIQCAHAMDIDYLEGEILMDRVVMQRNIDYSALLQPFVAMYGLQIDVNN